MEIQFKLKTFEGPLDLLLHLLEKNKVSIYDIPIVEITDQYMAYISQMPQQDLNTMSEFLMMAATLLDIKSRMLLPAEPKTDEEEEEDPRAELVARLLEYKMYQCISYELKDRQFAAGKALYRPPTIPREVAEYEQPVDLQELLGDLTLSRLNDIFNDVIKRQADKIDPIRSKFGRIEKEEVSMEETLSSVEQYALRHGTFSFRALLNGQKGKMRLIVTFLAVLELVKGGRLYITQEGYAADDIMLSASKGRSGCIAV